MSQEDGIVELEVLEMLQEETTIDDIQDIINDVRVVDSTEFENYCYLCGESEEEVTELVFEGDRLVCDNCLINR